MTHNYECGDYIKVEFPDEAMGIGEWMWIRVSHCDDERQLVFGICRALIHAVDI
jgi:hypothetical protein